MKDKENKYTKLDVVECDTIKKLNIIKNLPESNEERREVEKPKYNPNVWNRDEQVEKMAKILRDKCFYYLNDTSVQASEKVAEELLKYYQSKIPEDSVVLSWEEYEKLKLEIQRAHNKGVRVGFDLTKYKENSIAQASKETAEKILKELYMHFSADILCGIVNFNKHYNSAKVVSRLAKQFGVEIGGDK